MTSPASDRQYTLNLDPIAVKHTFPLGKRKYTFSKSRDTRLSFGGSRCVTEHLEKNSSSRAYQRRSKVRDRGKKKSSPIGNLLKGHPDSEQSFDFWRSLGPTAKIPLLILPRQRTQTCKRALPLQTVGVIAWF